MSFPVTYSFCEPLRNCIEFLVTNKGYTPHEEWRNLERQFWGSESNSDDNSQVSVNKSVNFMKYKWVLVCRHLEKFLRDRLDIVLDELQVGSKDDKKEILDVDFQELYKVLSSLDLSQHSNRIQTPIQRTPVVRSVNTPLSPSTQDQQPMRENNHVSTQDTDSNNSTEKIEVSDLKDFVVVFKRARASSFSAVSNVQPINDRIKKTKPPPVPSRENRRKLAEIQSLYTKKENSQIEEALERIIWNQAELVNENKVITPTDEKKDIIQTGQTTSTAPITKPTWSQFKRPKGKKGKYFDLWNNVLEVCESFQPTRLSEDVLFYSHDRDISLRFREMKYNREEVQNLMREYFIQPSVLDEILELFLQNESSLDKNLKTLQKIIGLPRSIGLSFDSLYASHREFLLEFGDVLIREPTMFLRSFFFLHQENRVLPILKDELTFQYFSQVLTMDEALCLLMHYGDEDEYMRLVVSILNRYTPNHLKVFLLQIVNSLAFFPNSMSSQDKPIVSFLLQKATEDFSIAQLLNWHLTVSAEHIDLSIRSKYRTLQYRLLSALKATNSLPTIINQQKLIQYLGDVSAGLKKMRISRKKKILLLKKILSNDKNIKKLPKFDWDSLFAQVFRLPLSDQDLIGIDSEHASIFKSAMQPFKIPFTGRHSVVSLIWKYGDDLRQDECVLLFIRTVDHLLKEEYNLDLKLTTYGCLATSPKSGFVEMVPNVATISQIKNDFPSFLAYLEHHNPPEYMDVVLSNYTKSLAGYCIISYLLCIGDRHMENILLSQEGKIFHIDFGFILGYDPKPFAPKIRITEDMIDVFGGVDTAGFKAFTSYCMLGFQCLRNHAGILILVMRMMALANLPHVSEASINKTLVRNLRLDLKDKDACRYFKKVFSKSLIALAPKITERIHSIAQSLRD